MAKNVIFYSFNFPPHAGSGVQRILKFIKYFHPLLQSDVVTSQSAIDEMDYGLLEDLPASTRIMRSNGLNPSNLRSYALRSLEKNSTSRFYNYLFNVLIKFRNLSFLPDAYIAWVPSTIKNVKFLIQDRRDSVIFSSVPIYTNAVGGYIVSRLFNLPLVLDFRDTWVDDPYLNLPTSFHKKINTWLESKVFNHASLILVYSDWAKRVYREKYPNKETHVIMNGYDPDDLATSVMIKKSEKVRYVYMGTVFVYSEEFIACLFRALSLLPQNIRGNLEIIFVGTIKLNNFHHLIKIYGLEDCVTATGYKSHSEALGYAESSDALLFTIPNGDVSSYSGKIFELLGMKKPIVGFVFEEGIAAELLRAFGHKEFIVNYSVDDAASILSKPILTKNWVPYIDTALYESINRKHQALKVAKLVAEL